MHDTLILLGIGLFPICIDPTALSIFWALAGLRLISGVGPGPNTDFGMQWEVVRADVFQPLKTTDLHVF